MLQLINPATGQLEKEIPATPTTDLHGYFEKAKRAQREWEHCPLSERIAIMRRFRELLVQHKEELAKLLTHEVGKPIAQARNELQGVLGRIDYFTSNIERVTQPELVFEDEGQKLREKITYEPLGVIVNISAWNYPYFVGANVFVPALLTGNAVLYKPSEYCPLTGLAIARYLHEAGVHKDVFTCILGGGLVGAELLELPINGVFFTGSHATGKLISEAVAPKLIRIQLELGGKDPAYVCEDVDVKVAAESLADGAFYNTGQSCCSVERIYVHAKIYDRFIENFMQSVKGFVLGDPMDDKTYIGPLSREGQLTVLDDQVADAVAKGAKLLIGGNRAKRPGYYFEPTVLTNVNHTMEVMREESFGPIIGIQQVGSDGEALNFMNDTAYGLTAGVYTRDPARAERLLAQVRSGSVYWNCCDRVSPRLPWSGRGHSGIGSTLGTLGIQAFVQPKAWHLKAT